MVSGFVAFAAVYCINPRLEPGASYYKFTTCCVDPLPRLVLVWDSGQVQLRNCPQGLFQYIQYGVI